MHKGFICTAAILGALTVLIGAFAAHALKVRLGTAPLATFETGVKYQFYHLFALLAAGILFKDYGSGEMLWAGRLFIAGIVLFSFSLYLLSFIQASGNTTFRWIGAITPFGGLCFVGGWIMLFLAVYKRAV